MRIALLTTFAATRKEPLAAIMDWVYGFAEYWDRDPFFKLNFGDGLIGGGPLSAVAKS
jgi:hypothetical protein